MIENIKEVILCKYGEVVLKGANRGDFEKKMLKELRLRARRIGNFNVFYSQSTIYIEPLDEESIERIDECIGTQSTFLALLAYPAHTPVKRIWVKF